MSVKKDCRASFYRRALPYWTEPLRSLGLDVDLLGLHLQHLRDTLAHGTDMGCETWRLRDHSAVNVTDAPPCLMHAPSSLGQQGRGISPFEGFVGVRKMAANIA